MKLAFIHFFSRNYVNSSGFPYNFFNYRGLKPSERLAEDEEEERADEEKYEIFFCFFGLHISICRPQYAFLC